MYPTPVRAVLIFLAAGWGAFGPEAQAEVKISHMVIDGRVQTLGLGSADPAREQTPWRIPGSPRALGFHFTAADQSGQPTARLRFRLDGRDETWRDLPTQMRALVRFFDPAQQVVGSASFPMEGQSPGWRGSVENSDFLPHREQATAPERATAASIAFITHGGSEGMGVIAIDAVRVLVERAGRGAPEVFNLDVGPGADLSHPLGAPDKWVRVGSRADLARVRMRPGPAPRPILTLEDDDPTQFGNWSQRPERKTPVQPGDQLTFEWQMAHSIGRCGPGQIYYRDLKPGRYWFRVAAAKANGELTGEEVSLPFEVVAPLYRRWEYWVGMLALAGAAAVGTRQIVLQRRMQQRLAVVEHEQTLERERARIARDLHDDIGAGLTEIAMQSDWVRRAIAPVAAPDTVRRIERVCQSAVELTRSVDEIVWAVNPAHDAPDHFANYLCVTTKQFLDAAGLRVRFDIPLELPALMLPGKIRHALFQAAREALNNVSKHARADLVRLEMKVEGAMLRIVIEDNGCGFTPTTTGAAGIHEGLEGMRRRMEEIGGCFRLHSGPGKGTRVELLAPLRA